MDINKSKEVIKRYVEKYDVKNERIQGKIVHIQKVAENAKKIAEDLKLEKEDIQLAELIGLLHDIGRFEQLKRYNTYLDNKSVNHGELGVEILFQDGLIKEIIEDRKYDEIIRKAIINHNRDSSKIDKNVSQRELLHIKIIRDADKLDIYEILTAGTLTTEAVYGKKDLSNEKFTEGLYEGFTKNKKVDYSKLETLFDQLIPHFLYIFDINFKYSFKIIKEKEYIEKLYKRVENKVNEETKNKIKNIYSICKEYIKNMNER